MIRGGGGLIVIRTTMIRGLIVIRATMIRGANRDQEDNDKKG